MYRRNAMSVMNTVSFKKCSCCMVGQKLVTLQAQTEYPPDMQCKDKFLLQSTIVASDADVDELPQDTFNKDSGRTIQECKLRVVYLSPQAALGNPDDRSFDNNSIPGLQHLKDERDTAMRQTRQLQQELEMLKRRSRRKSDPGFSFTFALFVGLIGLMVGFLLNLSLSSPSTE
ncbi:hypothetical protein TEA_000885 [Camellia sinensis var. sinensis]|uniref:MSP domain-containing protein n=1 Tax=Camellia sinensis var. sinensis TaxID=542762 RepID=A0A4S4F302_CAMSN|nr:hypothetical protein TEA_000885 [Camellia sinensis var. sinensis]